MEIELARTVTVALPLFGLLLYWGAVVVSWRLRGRRRIAEGGRQAAQEAAGPEYSVAVQISPAELLVVSFALLLPVAVLLVLAIL